MLAELRKKIRELTSDKTTLVAGGVSRTIYVIVSPGMAHLKGWYAEWFPIPDARAEDMYQWLFFDGDEAALRTAAADAVARVFDAGLWSRLGAEDVRVVGVNQVLVVADLAEPGSGDRIATACRIVKEQLDLVLKGSGATVAWTGLIALRRVVPAAGTGSRSIEAADPADLKKLEGIAAAGLFRRLILTDVVNPRGEFLSEKDAHIMLGELLYLLTVYPGKAESPSRFDDEWLTQCPADRGFVSGGSAISLVLPVDQILETVTLCRGADVVERAFLSTEGLRHSQFYVQNFLHGAGLSSAEATVTTFSDDDDIKLDNPLASLDGLEPSRFDEFTAAVTAIDGSLPAAAKANAKKMREIAEKRLPDWKILLEDHVESILIKEIGGLPLAKRFLDDLRQAVQNLVPAPNAATAAPDNLAELLAALKKTIDTGPRTVTMLARALALSIVVGVGAYFLPLAFVVKSAVMVGVPLVSFGIAAWMILDFKDRVQKQGEQVRDALRKKWNGLMKAELDRVIREFLGALVEHVKQLETEAAGAEKRVVELVGFLRKRYVPPFPEEYAAWLYVVRNREDLLKFVDLCRPDMARVTDLYLSADRPLFPWRRLAPAKAEDAAEASDPNAWEWSLLEKAALRVLPACTDIIHLHVLAYLQGNDRNLERCRKGLLRVLQPFLRLEPERTRASEDTRAVFEVEDEAVQPVAHELLDEVRANFELHSRFAQTSRYRISLFGFVENVRIGDVLLDEE